MKILPHAFSRFSIGQRAKDLLTAVVLVIIGQHIALAQTGGTLYWKDISESAVKTITGKRVVYAKSYRTLSLDIPQMQKALGTAPLESKISITVSGTVIAIPHPDGKTYQYYVNESPIMAPELLEKFPDVRTYTVKSDDFEGGSGRIDVTEFGFHAMLFTPQGTVFIDPYQRFDRGHYICYYVRDYIVTGKTENKGNCVVDDPETRLEVDRILSRRGYESKIGNQLRTYRLALAADGEYTAYFGGTVNAAYSAMVTTMNRVNQVYINDLCIRMTLIANTSSLIYTNASTDPYTNTNGSTMLTENQTNVDNVIGTANYDIGHVFSTGGGGIAGLGVVCRAGLKAKGVTGSSAPVGDPYDIDYVAHEMGHQFGGNHTFNSTTGSCGGGNRNATTAYENGSGTTIMAYAGICGADNLQSNSDPYFHTKSIDEIVAYSNTGNGNNCPVVTATGNTAPVVTMPAGGYVIPISTPFALTATATDADGDALTYCWEEFDLGAAGAVGSPSGDAPIFRSLNPTTSGTRYFPKLSSIINNTTTFGEMLPTYARNLNFRCTVRDNKTVGGGVVSGTVTYTVSAAAGPFAVTAPNTAVSWAGLSAQTVTWNVASTSGSPVSCANVKILLSTDGGNTFPTTLLASTPNDGTETVTIPNTPTTTARIKVESIGNIFFDMSNANFTITQGAAGTVALTSPAGGEHWQTGSSKSITWTSTNVTNVKLEYSTNNGSAWTQITASTAAAAGSYLWAVPATPSTQSLIRITDAALASVGDTSGVFTIASLALTSPAGGEGWKAGSQKSITWSAQNVANIKIEYSSNNGAAWSQLTASTAASAGAFSWTVPGTPSAQNLIKISDVAYPAVADTNNTPFKITTLSLTSPAGGENWKAGTLKPVTWSNQNITTVKLEYSVNNGTDWNQITAGTPAAAGTYSWLVPFLASTQCLVRVSDSTDAATNSISGGVFTIYTPTMITSVQSPSATGQTTMAFGATNIAISCFAKTIAPVTVTYFPTEQPVPGNLPADIVGVSKYYWTIASTGLAFSSGVISIALTDLGGVTYPNKLVWLKRENPGDGWANIGGAIAGGKLSNTVQFGLFSEFALGTSDTLNVLPVELEVFSAAVRQNKVVLSWSTATEVNNAGFEIERAGGSGEQAVNFFWHKIGFIPGGGNSFSRKEYSFADAQARYGKYRYRLKQVDNNGTFTYSNTESVDLGAPREYALFQNFPNPFNPSTTISFTVPEKTAVSLSVYNQLGIKVADILTGEKDAGQYSVEWDASSLSSGVYYYELKTAKFSAAKKLTLIK